MWIKFKNIFFFHSRTFFQLTWRQQQLLTKISFCLYVSLFFSITRSLSVKNEKKNVTIFDDIFVAQTQLLLFISGQTNECSNIVAFQLLLMQLYKAAFFDMLIASGHFWVLQLQMCPGCRQYSSCDMPVHLIKCEKGGIGCSF